MRSITEQTKETAGGDLCVQVVPIFNHLPLSALTQIQALVHHVHFAAGDTLYFAGSQADALYIIHQGQVKIDQVTAGGRDQLIRLLAPGDFDGDQALFSRSVHQAEAVAMAPVVACVLRKPDFQQLIREHPDVGLAVMDELAQRLQQAEARATMTATRTVEARLADFLLRQGQAEFTLPMKKKELAAFLSTTPESISRKLRDFENAGWLKQTGSKQLTILDRAALTRVAAAD
ncbi:Crp/Fnr family transcriptional regulator [Lacticaseibacillus mingshuiensis]|uniref:Crp/Fnr family transcriptional regulator n=1 Tax=Lacticaseibacillus mingshuiensis TaxID=2799574 RepID=A0ABW4CM13_9LACO|nr:Crp/Fnr family transcriptional regulator [Lacticaseibacillus mingshuiensis]